MKKLFIMFAVISQIIFFNFARAQSITPPASMANKLTPVKAQPRQITPQQPVQTQEDAEIKGYSMSVMAYYFNDQCKLGLSRNTMDILLGELKKSEELNRMSKEDVQQNIDDAKKLYMDDPKSFCADAGKVADTLKSLFWQ